MAISLRETATGIVRHLQDAGFEAYWVGGCVRDFLLGREPSDYDIVTSARPENVEKLFRRTIPVGRKFGVIIVVEDNHAFEVATFRAEADYRDGRHPERVTFGNARADASRRDFTVNGLFYDPVRNETHDWVGGEADLRRGIIRTIGAPAERFAEDHLRLLRAVRFAARLGFEIESETFSALQSNAAKIAGISAERIRDELIKMFDPAPTGSPGAVLRPNDAPPRRTFTRNGLQAARGLELLHNSGLLQVILPELEATLKCDQSPDFHPEGSVFNHLLLMLRQMPDGADPLLPWAVLLHDIAKPVTTTRDDKTGSIHFYEHERIGAAMAEEILNRLRFPKKQTEAVVHTVRCHMQFKDALQMRRSTLRRLLMRPTFPLELELHRLDCLGSHGRLDVYDFLVQQSAELEKQTEIIPPLLTGDDLMAMGMKPGPAMGKMLADLREKQLQDELKTAEDARDWVQIELRRE